MTVRKADELPGVVEDGLIGVLMCPPGPGETHLVSAQRKERALVAIIDCLSVVQAMALGRRLDANRDDDRVAVAFRRFTADRRQRVRTYIAEARRRSVLAAKGS